MATYRKRKRSDGTSWVLARIRIRGFQPVTKSFDDLKAAKTWAEGEESNLREQRQRGATRPDITTLTIGQLIDEHAKDAATASRKHRAKTNKNGEIAGYLGWWKNYFGAKKVFEVGPVLARDARDLLQRSGQKGKRANGSVNRYIAQMRSCWNWGRAAGLIGHTRLWPSRLMLPEPKGRTRFLTPSEITRLLKAAESDLTIRSAIVVSLVTGIRQAELLNLKWSDIDFERRTATILETKNDESRSVPLTDEAIAALRVMQQAKVVSTTHIFLNTDGTPLQRRWLSRRWERVLTAAEIEDFNWHDLRHTCASILAQSGATLQEIQTLLGHKTVHMVTKYAHLLKGRLVTGHDRLDAMLKGQ